MKEWLAVHEQIFFFKGWDSIKQYDPKKTLMGFQNFCFK